MSFESVQTLLQQHYDCIILANPDVHILEQTMKPIQEIGLPFLNIGKGLSASLLTAALDERSRIIQKWLIGTLTSLSSDAVICTYPDLLFEPSLNLDPLKLFRQAARFVRIMVLWPGDYSANTLSYAVPEHNHFRSWKISDTLLRQPETLIQRITTSQGA